MIRRNDKSTIHRENFTAMWSKSTNWIKLSIVSPKEHSHNYNAIVTVILSEQHIYKCWIYLEYCQSHVFSIQQHCAEPFEIFNLNQRFSYNIELFATCESLSRRPGQHLFNFVHSTHQLLRLRALHSSLIRITTSIVSTATDLWQENFYTRSSDWKNNYQ